jgi:hypothetical protein
MCCKSPLRSRTGLLEAEGEAEVGLDLLAGGAAGRVAKDDIVRDGIFLGRREQEIDFVIVSGIDGVEGGSVAVAVAEIGVLAGVEENKIDVGGVVADGVASGAGNRGSKSTMQTREGGVRGHLEFERGGLFQREGFVEEVDRLHVSRVDVIEGIDRRRGRCRLGVIASRKEEQGECRDEDSHHREDKSGLEW